MHSWGVALRDCMCDLGACESIMPLSIYETLHLDPLKPSDAKFVLADKSITAVKGKAEDVLLQIDKLYDIIDELVAEIDQPEKEESGSNEDAIKQLLDEPRLEKEASPTLKPLPPHLKYAFLGKDEELPVIISGEHSTEEERLLVDMLK
ncbi:hypothetical protein PIB30_080941 [Stylosanthes scabra]|uniref:Uncharacterized protein n=1 Tax=Stylosanthes scabra TaxID=79078 RepID=A0ABU6WUB6_9FABA|nr:hypothetical protein [Stylosanthes scabra]